MEKYCKAYYLKALRQFPNWSSNLEGNVALPDDIIVYLWDDFTVVKSPIIHNKEILWNDITPEWQEFCKTILGFEIPEELRYAYEQGKE